MVVRPTSPRIIATAEDIGEQLTSWRKLLNLTAAQVADRAGISRSTMSKVENGDTGVNYGAFLKVIRALGLTEALLDATDPYNTDLGRARADESLPKRVRR